MFFGMVDSSGILSQAAPLIGVMLTSALASAINSIAGGGTFLTFPALTGLAHLSEKSANMTSTIGIWPGQLASIAAAKADFAQIPKSTLVSLSIISLTGGLLGALLLLSTSPGTFRLLIPWLLAFATVLFAFSKPIARWAGHRHGTRTLKWTLIVSAMQFLVAIYGGYFGAGIGVLMLAALSFTGLENLNQINALKVFLAAQINGIAVVIFMLSSIWIPAGPERMNWLYALSMMPAGVLGGFFGMRFARNVKQSQLRTMILLIGIVLTGIYFYRAYGMS